ncbi:MAG: glycosyltransferase [Candidatus Gastranaerophilales bacterium]|nr:glycosyltransferase [Candidatus Gastranaerophilales bacterium]
MKISIITVCKNAEKTIENTILSVLNQTYKNIELIIIDGVSTDGTLDIINKYKDKISYFISEPDTGVYNAMNKGIKAATGNILYFLNANDSLYDNYVLENVVTYFQKDKNLDVLYGNIQYVDKNQVDVGIFKYNDFCQKLTFIDRNICHQAIFYNSRTFKKYGLYDETYRVYADYEYNVRLFVKHKIKTKYIDMFIARFEAGGLSYSYNKEILKEEFQLIYDKYFKDNKLHQIDRFFMKYFGSIYKRIKRLLVLQ